MILEKYRAFMEKTSQDEVERQLQSARRVFGTWYGSDICEWKRGRKEGLGMKRPMRSPRRKVAC